MALLFGPSRRDQVHLVSALQSLTPTSVAGLAAALSWSERKTERVLRELASAHGSAVVYDPSRRLAAVRHAAAHASISGGVATPAPAPGGTPVAATPKPPVLTPAPPSARPSHEAAPPLPRSLGGGARCSSCQVPLIPTSSGEAAVCPQCGRLSTRLARPAAAPRSDPGAPALSSVPVPLESGRTVVHSGDRRSQELFAAWVTSRPIPCPRCRTNLRHRGVGEYGCPSCGHRVTFETSVKGLGASSAPGGSPAPPS